MPVKKLLSILGVVVLAAPLLLSTGCKQGGGSSAGKQSGSAPMDTTGAMPDTMGGAMKGGMDPPAAGAVSFAKDVEPLFTKKCSNVSCHGIAKSAGLQLSEGLAYQNTVNVASSEVPRYMRIKPGAPDSSYLMMKLEGRQTFGAKMPLVGGPLSDKQIQTVRSWIQAGAKKE